MKIGIYFFTGTGNSLRSVKILKEELEQKSNKVDIIDISKTKDVNIDTYDKIGIVFPIYCLGIPSIIKTFIRENNFAYNQYIFAIANCGSSSGIAFSQINNILKKDKKRLNLSLTIRNGANNNLFINIPGTSKLLSKEEQIIAYNKSKKDLIAISDFIHNSKDKNTNKLNFSEYIKSYLAHYIFMKGLKKYPSKFRTTNKCKKCGMCVKNCPVGNIDEGIKWNSKCEACLRCFTICPNKAIEHGKMKDSRMFKRFKIEEDVKGYIYG